MRKEVESLGTQGFSETQREKGDSNLDTFYTTEDDEKGSQV